MQTGIKFKYVLLTFVLSLVFYIAAYSLVEHLRHRKGPWDVLYSVDAAEVPVLTINQPALGIANFQLKFPGETTLATNLPQRILFAEPSMDGPFGEVIYDDLTFLPGVVTYNLFGHEIELLPRVLIINKREVPWRSGEVIELDPKEKPAVPPHPPKGGPREVPRPAGSATAPAVP